MKKILVLVLCVLLTQLCVALAALADPRMETNANFCHFILDSDNTDNEVFMAGCDSVIRVIENQKPVEPRVGCGPGDYTATGYAKVVKLMPRAAVPVPPGQTLVLTSEDSSTPCTMVESNGIAYTSYKWQNRITVQGKTNGNGNGLLKVDYELICMDGVQ